MKNQQDNKKNCEKFKFGTNSKFLGIIDQFLMMSQRVRGGPHATLVSWKIRRYFFYT